MWITIYVRLKECGVVGIDRHVRIRSPVEFGDERQIHQESIGQQEDNNHHTQAHAKPLHRVEPVIVFLHLQRFKGTRRGRGTDGWRTRCGDPRRLCRGDSNFWCPRPGYLGLRRARRYGHFDLGSSRQCRGCMSLRSARNGHGESLFAAFESSPPQPAGQARWAIRERSDQGPWAEPGPVSGWVINQASPAPASMHFPPGSRSTANG